MKVSVIIPAYNAEKTIKRCMESVLNQTLSDIEIIAVNDGSKDGTPDILNSFSDCRLTVISQDNSGQGAARNLGMSRARGEYISFVDADDTIEPDMLKEMYNRAKEYDAEIVQCNLWDIFSDGTRRLQLDPLNDFVEISDNAEYFSNYLAVCIHSYEVCNKIFKRDFIKKNNLKFADTRKYFSEDILFNMEAVKYLKRVCFYGAPCYNYYQNSESHMHSNASERVLKMEELFSDYIKTVDGKMKLSASYLASMVMLYNIGACDDKELSAIAVKKLIPLIKTGLRAVHKKKHRIFLTAVLYAPMNIKLILTRLFAER